MLDQYPPQLGVVASCKGRAIRHAALVKAGGSAPHFLGHRQVARRHLAQGIVHVGNERLHQQARQVGVDSRGFAQPLHDQEEVKHDHLIAAGRCVWNAKAGVKLRPARLRHDRAINLASFAAYVRAGIQEFQHQRRAHGLGQKEIRGRRLTELQIGPLQYAERRAKREIGLPAIGSREHIT